MIKKKTRAPPPTFPKISVEGQNRGPPIAETEPPPPPRNLGGARPARGPRSAPPPRARGGHAASPRPSGGIGGLAASPCCNARKKSPVPPTTMGNRLALRASATSERANPRQRPAEPRSAASR